MAKKDGRPPPEGRPISYVAMAVYPQIRPGCAPHAGGKVRHLAQRRNREIPDQQGYPRQSSLAPAVARMIPSLMHIPLSAPRLWRLDSEQPRCISTENSAPRRIVEPVCALDKADRVDFAHIRRIVGAHQDVIGAVLLDEITQLVMRLGERVELEPPGIGRRHFITLLRAIVARS